MPALGQRYAFGRHHDIDPVGLLIPRLPRLPGLIFVSLVVCLFGLSALGLDAFAAGSPWWRLDSTTLANIDPPISVQRAWAPGPLSRRPVILLLGSLATNSLPDWSTNLVREGYMLVAFTAAHPPDPDPSRRAQWLVFDERFAHSYVLGGARTPADASRVIDHLVALPDVDRDRIGWMGSSTTGILGLAVATREPRLKTLVAFVATGAYERWLETWKPNGLWRSGANGLWLETRSLLPLADPIHSVSNLFPKAILLVNGGEDKVVDPASTRAFFDAARPFYARDPERLRFVRYEGFGHNLPSDVVRLYTEHWFHLYLHPTQPPPPSPKVPASLEESARRTAVTASPHDEAVGAIPVPSRRSPIE
ncbi:MAG: prolyl oligopeptidase family serine peptidase [Verrucomicrobia bacterium]|nr:prolyl oligopeptidase family serine peptidase [Verrucomicrobiota bacterium]MBI3867257.1 prolyl oligopeptidase family serine peptidase [Verrucomicrobiota bacterium]